MVKVMTSLMVAALFVGCGLLSDPGSDPVTDLNITLIYAEAGDSIPVSGAEMTLQSVNFNSDPITVSSDSTGRIHLSAIPAGLYSYSVSADLARPAQDFPDSSVMIPLVASGQIDGKSGTTDAITIALMPTGSNPGLKINELYVVGPVNNDYYFQDQFIELVNSSSDTVYLDGNIICRMKDSYEVQAVFAFPGNPGGHTYPLAPAQYSVIAEDALNHQTLEGSSIVYPTSVDLSGADWEFKNSADVADWDNPDVPNLDNLEEGYTKDFMVNLISDIVLIANGEDRDFTDGIDYSTILDCVEYSSKQDYIKDVDPILDRGWAGVGMERYSGQSMQRIAPGMDSNNSTADFEIMSTPTPGY